MWNIFSICQSSHISWSCRPKGIASKSIFCSNNLLGVFGSARIILLRFLRKGFWGLWNLQVLICLFQCSWSWRPGCLLRFIHLSPHIHLLFHCLVFMVISLLSRGRPSQGNLWFRCNNVLWNGFSCFWLQHLVAGFWSISPSSLLVLAPLYYLPQCC